MSKVLVAWDYRTDDNPFVRIIADGLADLGHEVYYGVHEFWNTIDHYDALWINWPEELIGWDRIPDQRHRDMLLNRLGYFVAQGTKILTTVHNMTTHYSKNPQDSNLLYKLLWDKTHTFIHLGNYSKTILSDLHPNQRHELIPHHTYNTIYDQYKSLDSRRVMKVEHYDNIVLAFGKFRNNEEVMLFINYAKKFSKDDLILAPRMLTSNIDVSRIKDELEANINVGYSHQFLSIAETAHLFNICTEVFIPRLHLLNSGNVALAKCFNRKVVYQGSTHSNVPEWVDFDAEEYNRLYNDEACIYMYYSLI